MREGITPENLQDGTVIKVEITDVVNGQVVDRIYRDRQGIWYDDDGAEVVGSDFELAGNRQNTMRVLIDDAVEASLAWLAEDRIQDANDHERWPS